MATTTITTKPNEEVKEITNLCSSDLIRRIVIGGAHKVIMAFSRKKKYIYMQHSLFRFMCNGLNFIPWFLWFVCAMCIVHIVSETEYSNTIN